MSEKSSYIVMERMADDETELQRYRGEFASRQEAESWIAQHCGDYYIAEGVSIGY